MKPARSITSRDNPLLQRVRKLVRDPAAYRKMGELWIEGEHLCSALVHRGGSARHALVAESAMAQDLMFTLADRAAEVSVVPDRLFAQLSALPSPAGIGFLCALPQGGSIEPRAPTVVLDRVQDPGNVGSILRTAGALGVSQVLAITGTAALWSAKVLRAGMGAHFALHLTEDLAPDALKVLQVPLVAASAHAGAELQRTPLPHPCAWVFGHEGQGLADAVLQRCALQVRIPQPGGQESLNVAAAAAICLYESQRQRADQ
jgi:TrmH family RNA methyltransferase